MLDCWNPLLTLNQPAQGDRIFSLCALTFICNGEVRLKTQTWKSFKSGKYLTHAVNKRVYITICIYIYLYTVILHKNHIFNRHIHPNFIPPKKRNPFYWTLLPLAVSFSSRQLWLHRNSWNWNRPWWSHWGRCFRGWRNPKEITGTKNFWTDCMYISYIYWKFFLFLCWWNTFRRWEQPFAISSLPFNQPPGGCLVQHRGSRTKLFVVRWSCEDQRESFGRCCWYRWTPKGSLAKRCGWLLLGREGWRLEQFWCSWILLFFDGGRCGCVYIIRTCIYGLSEFLWEFCY